MQEDKDQFAIPRTLDDPGRIFWWDVDQALLVCVFLVFGMVAGFLAVGACLGMFFGWLYGKAKSGKHKGFAVHILYWYLPAEVFGLKRTPPSHQREWIG